jgi:hypothetical protein
MAFLHAILSEEDTRVAWTLLLMTIALVAAVVACERAIVAAARGRECERLRKEVERLRPLAEVTEVQTATARLMLGAADVQTDARNMQEQESVRQLPAATDTTKEQK